MRACCGSRREVEGHRIATPLHGRGGADGFQRCFDIRGAVRCCALPGRTGLRKAVPGLVQWAQCHLRWLGFLVKSGDSAYPSITWCYHLNSISCDFHLLRCRRRALGLDRRERPQYTSRSGRISCRMVVAISSMDLVVDDSQRMPARRIMASASATSWRQFCRLA